MLLSVLADVAGVPTSGWGVLGGVLIATITGWFSLRANRQEHEGRATKRETFALRTEVTQALDVVQDLTRQLKSKDARIERLQKALDACNRRSRSR